MVKAELDGNGYILMTPDEMLEILSDVEGLDTLLIGWDDSKIVPEFKRITEHIRNLLNYDDRRNVHLMAVSGRYPWTEDTVSYSPF